MEKIHPREYLKQMGIQQIDINTRRNRGDGDGQPAVEDRWGRK
jgi:hypothetical protein